MSKSRYLIIKKESSKQTFESVEALPLSVTKNLADYDIGVDELETCLSVVKGQVSATGFYLDHCKQVYEAFISPDYFVIEYVPNEVEISEKKPLYARICKDFDEWDLDNIQAYTEEELRDEAVQIDYVDEEEIEDMDINDLIYAFAMNDEYVVELK